MSSSVAHQPTSKSVVKTVAAAENVDPVDLEIPLYAVVDPDALDSLFVSSNGQSRPDGEVIFEYCGYTVVVASDGTVTLADEPAVPGETSTLSD